MNFSAPPPNKKPKQPKQFPDILNIKDAKKFIDEFLFSAKQLQSDVQLPSQFDQYMAHLLTHLYQSDPGLQGCPFLGSRSSNLYELLKRGGPIFKAIFDTPRAYMLPQDWPMAFLPIRTQKNLHMQNWGLISYFHGITSNGFIQVDSPTFFLIQFATFPFTHILGSAAKPKSMSNSLPFGIASYNKSKVKTMLASDAYVQLFKNYLKYFLPLPNDKSVSSLPDLNHHSMRFLDIFADQWLNRLFDEIPVKNRNLLLGCIDSLITRLLHRQYDHLASRQPDSEYFCQKLRIVLAPLYSFFRTSFSNWPLDQLDQMQVLVDLWLKILTPWKTTKIKGAISNESEKMDHEHWSEYMDATLPFYTVLLTDVLRLSVNFAFSEKKVVKMLEKVLQFYTPALVHELKMRESMLYNRLGTYSVRMDRMVNWIQTLTSRDVQLYTNEYLIFTNQETTVLAQEVATEFSRYQVRSHTKPRAAAGFWSSFTTAKKAEPKSVSLDDAKIIKELKRLFHISTPRNMGADFFSPTAETDGDGMLTDLGRKQVQKGTHTCPPLKDWTDIDVWSAPQHSWERETLLKFAKWVDQGVQVLVFPESQTHWQNHWLYGWARKLASVYFWWQLTFLCLLLWVLIEIIVPNSTLGTLVFWNGSFLIASASFWHVTDL